MKLRRRVVAPIVILLIAGVIAIVVFLRGSGADDLLEASGTIEATEARLGFPMPGRVEEVLVREGDRVEAGAELARLDAEEARARLSQAEAQIAQASAALAELERGSRREEIASSRAAAAAAEQRREDAQRDFDRARALHEGGAVSREALDKAGAALEIAKSGAEQAAEQLRLVQIGPREERIAAARAQLAQAQASRDAASATLADRTIRAPFAGVVTERHVEPGEIVGSGISAVTVLNPDDRWVRIYVPERQIGRVHRGGGAAISTDTFPEKTYRGEVVWIASEAEFTPKTVQTKEERVRLVYAVKVRILEDDGQELKPGMPADVRFTAAVLP
jgi:HlyD family secretion protein